MAIAPNLGPCTDAPSEGVALRDRAVGADADDLPLVIGKVLCRIAAPPVAEGEKEIAVRGEGEAPANLLWTRSGGALEQHLLIGESFVPLVELRLHHPHLGGVLLTDEIGKIDRAVADIVRIDSEIDQAAMRDGQHFRDAGYCAGLAANPDKLKPAGFFSDEE